MKHLLLFDRIGTFLVALVTIYKKLFQKIKMPTENTRNTNNTVCVFLCSKEYYFDFKKYSPERPVSQVTRVFS